MNKGKKANVISTIALVVLLLVGLSVMLYPIFSDWWNSHTQSIAITDYDKVVKDTVDEKKIEMLKSAQQFNKNLLTIENRFSTTTKIPGYECVLDVSGTGVMGYITIPSINVELPIYHGTSPEVLNIAVGHMEGSSLPIGGESTHAVISAHRGLPSATLFSNLDKLVEGDTFTITILNEVYTYQVDKISIVLPYEMDALDIVEGEDLVTLMTCTPYGINTHRLLVRGKRIETILTPVFKIDPDAKVIDTMIVFPIVAAPMVLILILYWIFGERGKKRKQYSIEDLGVHPHKKDEQNDFYEVI